MIFQFRDAEMETLMRMHACLEQIIANVNAAGPCSARLEILGQMKPALMASGPQNAIVDAAEALTPDDYALMPSGAAHDAQVMAPHIPSAMMFVPSIGGISHHWSEKHQGRAYQAGRRGLC